MKRTVIKYALILLLLFLAYQQVQLYIDGIAKSPLVSVFRYDAPLRKLREIKLKKDEQKATVHGKVQVIVPKSVTAPQEEVDKHPEQSFTIGRWEFDEACRRGGVIEVNWQPSTGKVDITYDAPPDALLALGRLREIGLWSGYAWTSDGLKSPLIALEGRVDLFRVGPAWAALRAGAQWRKIQISGYSQKSDTMLYAQIGVPILRW